MNSRLFLHTTCYIQSHILKFQPFWLHLLFFMYLMIYFELSDPVIGKHYNWTQKGWNLAWYHHLTHIACVQKLRGLWQTLDALRVQTGPSLSKYEGFRRKLICFKGISFFLNLLQLKTFFHSICTIQSHVLKFQPFLTSFAIFHAFNDLFWAKCPCNWKALQLNSEKVETWHGIIIWAT